MENTNYIVILKLQYVLESSGRLVKTQTIGLHLQVSDSVGLE